ncbi:MAG: SAM-dependent methyltransferase [Anaerolineales bacterium]|nr:SAM-dependent methyltransferase [Anaerolineales bacterium]
MIIFIPNVPKGTTVIYSDFDPVVVEYARDILQNTPDVYFFEADAREPEELLGRPEVLKILGDRRRVGFVLWGVPVFYATRKFPTHCESFMIGRLPQLPGYQRAGRGN